MPAKNKPFFRQFTTSSFSFLPSTMSIVTLRYVKMINGTNPPPSKKRRVKTCSSSVLQIIDVRSEGKKKIILLPPEEEKRNETKFIDKSMNSILFLSFNHFDWRNYRNDLRRRRIETVVRKCKHHLLACLKFISQKGITIIYFFRVRRFSMINY